MPSDSQPRSLGIVTPSTFTSQQALVLDCGQTLHSYELVYETYGELNDTASNAILVCHALSGSHHAAGYHSESDKRPGWWNAAIGPGKAIDTNKFFVVCSNNLGGCDGSTGPASPKPHSDELWAADFPLVTVRDWVRSQHQLMRHLGISQWAAVAGGSLGGMQALQWSLDFPDLLKHCVIIAAAPNLTAQNIAFNEVARQAILTDPEFCDGHYVREGKVPNRGLMLARMLGHITYLSNDAMGEKFGRQLQRDKLHYDFGPEYQVESYLRYQGEKFVGTFDANTYLLMTKALDYFDPARDYEGTLAEALTRSSAQFFIASFTTDWRFQPERSEEIVNALIEAGRDVSYIEVDSPNGHDAFLLDTPYYMGTLRAYLENIDV